MDKVKFLAGITVPSSCFPDPPAPMKRCWARLKPSILASSNAAQSARRSANRATYRPIIVSNDASSSSAGRLCLATPNFISSSKEEVDNNCLDQTVKRMYFLGRAFEAPEVHDPVAWI